jgi:predicted transcriptional regulator of viral defense system
MPSPVERALALLEAVPVARSKELEEAGLSRSQIQRLHEQGVLERVARGLYRLPEAPATERQHLAEAARLVPDGVVCLLSALRFHGLTTQNPFEVWMAIHQNAWRPQVDQPPLRLVHMSGPSFEEGVEDHDLDGVPVQVFSAAKTVADCFKFRNKIGVDVAVEALRDFRRLHPKELEAVWRFAEVNRVGRVVAPYLESLE